MGGNFPAGNFLGGGGGLILGCGKGGNFPGGNLPAGNFPGGVIFRGAIFLGAFFRGALFPRAFFRTPFFILKYSPVLFISLHSDIKISILFTEDSKLKIGKIFKENYCNKTIKTLEKWVKIPSQFNAKIAFPDYLCTLYVSYMGYQIICCNLVYLGETYEQHFDYYHVFEGVLVGFSLLIVN